MLKALDPYKQLIKMGLLAVTVVVIFSLGSWAGCSVGKNHNSDVIQKLGKQNATLTAQLTVVNDKVEEANRQVEANKRFAKEREELAENAAKEAAKAKKELAVKHKEFEQKLKAASKDPDCQAILEQELCPLLRNY